MSVKEMLTHDSEVEQVEQEDDGLGAFRGIVNRFVAYAVGGFVLITFLTWRAWW